MSITPARRFPYSFPPLRRRRLFGVLRRAPVALVLGLVVGGMLMCPLRSPWAGGVVVGVCLALFFVWPYAMTYRAIVDRTHGLPEAQPCAGPRLDMSQAGSLTEAINGPAGLIALGFEPAGWFFLDDVDQLYAWPWRHPLHPTVAYVQYLSAAGLFRLRFVTCLPGGGALVSTTRLADLAYPPPPGHYVQRRWARRPADLYGWHLEAERFLLGDRPAAAVSSPHITAELPPAGGAGQFDPARPDPVALYLRLLERSAWHTRLKRFWLLQFGLLRELWRQAHLTGMPISEQVEDGWAPPPPAWIRPPEEGTDRG